MPNINNVSITKDVIAPNDTFSISYTLDNTDGSSVYGSIIGCEVDIYANVDGTEYQMASIMDIFSGNGIINIGSARTVTVNILADSNSDMYTYISSNEVRALSLLFRFSILTQSSQVTPIVRTSINNKTIYAINKRANPTIETISFVRYNSTTSSIDDQGTDLLLTVKNNFTDISTYNRFQMKFQKYDSLNRTLLNEVIFDPTNPNDLNVLNSFLTGVTNDTILVGRLGVFNFDSSYIMRVYLGDNYESSQIRISIPTSFANVHLSAAPNGGVALGGFSNSTEDDPRFESNYDSYLYKKTNMYDDVNIYADLEVRDTSTFTGDASFKSSVSVPNGTVGCKKLESGTGGVTSSGGLSVTSGDASLKGLTATGATINGALTANSLVVKGGSIGNLVSANNETVIVYGTTDPGSINMHWSNLTIPYPASVTSPGTWGGGRLQIGYIGTHVFIRGSVNAKSGTILATIPAGLAPPYRSGTTGQNYYSLRPCGGARIARIYVNPDRQLVLEWVRNISNGEEYTAEQVWVDCNFDYWIE